MVVILEKVGIKGRRGVGEGSVTGAGAEQFLLSSAKLQCKLGRCLLVADKGEKGEK